MMDSLLDKVKANLILEHSADDALLENDITAAVSYAESYQHIPKIPCLQLPSKPSLCCRPISMNPGTAAQAASLLTARMQRRRYGTRLICFSDWIGDGRYELRSDESLCGNPPHGQNKGQRGIFPFRGCCAGRYSCISGRQTRLTAVGKSRCVLGSYRPVPLSHHSLCNSHT